MQKQNGIRVLALCAAVMLLIGTTAQAALLTTGNTLFPAPAEGDPAPGAVQLATITVPFSAPNNFSGTLSSTVYTNDASNPFGADRMTFVYQLTNATLSQNVLARLVLDSFTDFQTDASYQPGPGVAPTLIDRLTAGDVGFSFNAAGAGPIPPGSNSTLLVVQTDAFFFGGSNGSVIDGAQVTGITALGPFIPEPASLGALALAGLVLRRRR